jgi:cysteine-S-conjugate beta-lyase
MMFDFDRVIDLRNTHSAKWDRMGSSLQITTPDAIPMWIADMDFTPPPAVTEALHAEVARGVHGYYDTINTWRDACCGWLERRHGWRIDPDWISITPGVASGLAMVMQAHSKPGDGVVLFPPVYHAFRTIIEANRRQIIDCPLRETQGRFEMDLDRLANELPENARLVIFCSPHNPGGTVWSEAEVQALADLCIERGLILVADEIHNDLVYPEARHTVTALAAPQVRDSLITCVAASKTFNLAGALTGAVITSNSALKQPIDSAIKAAAMVSNNRFAMIATEAAWRDGDSWLEAALVYLRANRDHFANELVRAVPGARVMPMQATYLAWVDFSGTGLAEADIVGRIKDDARIGVSPGHQFGPGGAFHARFNLATQRHWLDEALHRLADAFADLR